MSHQFSKIKKIEASQIKVGMYIHDLCCDWMAHPFVRNRFLIESEQEIRKITDAGIREIYIDTDKGLDVKNAPTREEVREQIEQEMVDIVASQPARTIRTSLEEELIQAREIKGKARLLVGSLMHDARLGKAIELDRIEPVVQSMTDSIFRNSSALLGLLQIRNKDDYTFLHSVSVCALLVAFCRSFDMDSDTIHQAGIGGLLHDIGKSRVKDEILNKPGKLTDEEFAIIKKHPEDSHDILSNIKGIGPIPMDIALHHHERYNGSGYPEMLEEERIGKLAQMAAIVDVYDAITADRCYHKGMPAVEALRKIYEWSKFHFNPQMVHAFLRCVGIYPVGTLVLLESAQLGVVIEINEKNLLAPKLNVFFNTKSNTYIKPREVDLSRPMGHGGGDRIISHESPAKWNIDPMRFAGLA